jgi:hypothetical protein
MLLFKTIFGSHLYGTDTPSSDRDYKGVFMESLEAIVLKKDRDVITESTGSSSRKNTAADIDTELKELRTFIKDCLDGQTYAYDMLFAPPDGWIHHTPIWESLLEHREKLLSKNLIPFVTYCRHQAGKYGLKGSRLGELLRLTEFLKTVSPKQTLADALQAFDYKDSEFLKPVSIYNKRLQKDEAMLEVLGKRFLMNSAVKIVTESLDILYEKYGSRARRAQQNDGVDWKAISHAYRVMYELEELMTTGKIIFPLRHAPFLKRVKQGEIDYTHIQDELYDLMLRVTALPTHLPAAPDAAFWERWLVEQYIR